MWFYGSGISVRDLFWSSVLLFVADRFAEAAAELKIVARLQREVERSSDLAAIFVMSTAQLNVMTFV